MIDEHGYRLNVGIILLNKESKVLWAKRRGMADAWQFPQGGLQEGESTTAALYRELEEELGLTAEHVQIIAESAHWYHYHLPEQYIRYGTTPLCIGQKQRWFLLELTSPDSCIALDKSERPEFDYWHWVDYWHPIEQVIAFKRDVYEKVLAEFAPIVHK